MHIYLFQHNPRFILVRSNSFSDIFKLSASALHRLVRIRSFPTASISRRYSVETMAAKYQTQVKELVSANPVMVFSKSWCPYCRQAKQTLDNENVEHTDLELDQIDVGDAIQSAIYELTSQRTVPAIFIGGNFVGGNSDLQALKRNGQLKALLQQAFP
ncbi:thioredoxin-like protein [Lipomyces starkeyi]